MSIGFHLDDWERESLSDSHEVYELNKQIRNLKKQLETVRAEVIKEFAERLKDAVDEPTKIDGEDIDFIIDIIDSLVKEMTEEHNGTAQT